MSLFYKTTITGDKGQTFTLVATTDRLWSYLTVMRSRRFWPHFKTTIFFKRYPFQCDAMNEAEKLVSQFPSHPMFKP